MWIPVNQISYMECRSVDLLSLNWNGNICTRTIADLTLLFIFSPFIRFHHHNKFDGNTFCFLGNPIIAYYNGLVIIITTHQCKNEIV